MIRLYEVVLRAISGLILVTFIVFFSEITVIIIQFLENFSPNKSLSVETGFLIKFAFAVFLMLLAFSIFLSFSGVRKQLKNVFRYIINLEKIKLVFLKDEILGYKRLNVFIISGGTIASCLLLFIYLFSGVAEQEGILEMAASSLFLISALMLLFSYFQLNYKKHSKKSALTLQVILLGGSFLLFLVFGEEISWGQHFFEWESSGIFKDGNFQQETNMHNFLNPVFKYLYPLFGIGLLVFLSLVWFFPNNRPLALELLFPPASLFFVTIFLSGTSVIIQHETFEQIFGVFTFLYSMRVAVCSVHLAKKEKLQKMYARLNSQSVSAM